MSDAPDVRDAARRLEGVQAILDVPVPSLVLQDFLTALLERLRSVLGADRVTLVGREHERFVERLSVGMVSEPAPRRDVAIDQGIARQVADRRGPVAIADLDGNAGTPDPLIPRGVRSVAAVPLLFGEELTGILAVGAVERRDLGADVVLLNLVARRAANALAGAEIEQQREAPFITVTPRRLSSCAPRSTIECRCPAPPARSCGAGRRSCWATYPRPSSRP